MHQLTAASTTHTAVTFTLEATLQVARACKKPLFAQVPVLNAALPFIPALSTSHISLGA